jgi:hypothetical protein
VIIRIQRGGKSFKWLGTYLTHDADKAQTSERVAWTHTLNLANDHVPSAIDELYWTYRAADQLKRAAGVPTGGSRLKHPVKHFSLNWAPSDDPTQPEMIEAVRDYLRHMGWQDHQAVLVAHSDKHYRHVHVMVNAVSPIDGRSLDAGFERNRAQAWALDYEQTRFRVHCQQRLIPKEQREPAPTREAWEKMKEAEHSFDQDEASRAARAPDYFDRHAPDQWQAKEWRALHSYQKAQRTDFFAGGKKAYRDVRNAVFREVRTEFRPEWKAWFKLLDEGIDLNLLGVKEGILKRQNAVFEKRRDEACKQLRAARDEHYAELLKQQREERAELTDRQKDGLRTYELLDRMEVRPGEEQLSDLTIERREELRAAFRSAAGEATERSHADEASREQARAEPEDARPNEKHKVRDPIDTLGLSGLGALGAIAELGERFFEGFFGGGSAKPTPRPRPKQPSNDNSNARSAERSQRTEESIAEEAARLHAYWEERRRSRARDRD